MLKKKLIRPTMNEIKTFLRHIDENMPIPVPRATEIRSSLTS